MGGEGREGEVGGRKKGGRRMRGRKEGRKRVWEEESLGGRERESEEDREKERR